MWNTLRRDIEVVFERDPAARSVIEIVLNYPGLHAIWSHRISSGLWRRGWHLSARLVSQVCRFLTGIEIHPGARIGRGLFIDHGMGIVIGETVEVGANVTLYHGVTLGGVSWQKGKRHPTLGDHVVVGAGAKVLGPVTIGSYTRIGANSVVVRDIPENSVVVGVPGRVRERTSQEVEALHLAGTIPLQTVDRAPDLRTDLQHNKLPDVTLEKINELDVRLTAIEREIRLANEAFVADTQVETAEYDGPWNI